LAKSREIFESIVLFLGLTGFASSFPKLVGSLILVLIIMRFLAAKFKLRHSIIAVCLFLLLIEIITRRSTSLPNYLILCTYLLSLGIRKGIPRNLTDNVVVIVLFINIVLLLTYPGATQYLNFEEELLFLGYPKWLELFLSNTIVSFMFVLYSLRRRKLLITLGTFLFLVLAAKTTSLILYVFFLAGLNISISSLSRLVIIGVASIFMVSYLNLVPDYLTSRLNAILELETSAEYFVRFKLMLIGFETFINNPIIGIGYYRVYFESISEVLKLPIGHHSHFIDSLGRFGILGLFMLFLELSRWRRYSLVLPIFLWLLLNNIVSFEWLLIPILINYEEHPTSTSGIERRGNREVFA
jgi:hypothetical protein